MDFPILDITDDALAEHWLRKYFHPNGLQCPACQAGRQCARSFGQTRRSQVMQYRCRQCDKVYTVYSGMIFANKYLCPAQVIRLLRGTCKGESAASIARELQLAYDTIHHLRQQLHTNAIRLQSETPLPDAVTETDEMFQNAGEKRRKA